MSIGEAQGATGALVVGIGVIGAIWMATRQQKITQYIGVILLGLGIVGSIAVGILFLQPSSKIHEAFVAKKTDARFIFWQIAADGIKERPIIGWGPENYSVLYHKHFNPDILSSYNTSEVWVDKPHNATLEMFVAGGIPGGIFYVIFLGMFIVLPVSLIS